ncbi:MAG: hypothetical protein CMB99_10305 [Flavobacteriaceae bacterium]|nr:hypothetical protein [Flavobacteriaceae bacterium]|tara:strand:- start:276981 stop:277577 length:597 start_codon:yes stop_codon:yes gene_type:complete
MKVSRYILVFLIGFLIAKFWYQKDDKDQKKEQLKVVVNSLKNLKKLVVSSASFSEVYDYSDSKKYFYDVLSFDKKAIVTVDAKVEVGYDLNKMKIEIDSINKRIYINQIPTEEVTISPNVKYFDLQQSSFNAFSKEELNQINQKSIEKIKETFELTTLKEEAKERLFEEISQIYQLSKIYNWEVVDNTNSIKVNQLKY